MNRPDDFIRRNALESMQSQVEDFIRGKIQSGEWALGDKIPSERELAEKLDVSRTTVRNAVQALTSLRFFERRIGQGTFVRHVPDHQTQPKRPAQGTLGYVVCKKRSQQRPLASESFYFDVFSGVEEETVRSGRHLLFSYFDDQSLNELGAIEGFLAKIDGLVLEEAENPALLEMLVARDLPTVLLAPTLVDPRFDLVTMDLVAGARTAVDHLRGLGHDAIGIVTGPLANESVRDRMKGWSEALLPGGRTVGDNRVATAEDWSAEAGARAMDTLLGRCPEMTAVFCCNDLLAIGALSSLRRRGLRVPDDMSVIGFDDTEWARHAVPPLTTMKIHSRAMAKSAVRRLVERIDSSDLPTVRMEFPIDLVVRQSCGPHERNKKEE